MTRSGFLHCILSVPGSTAKVHVIFRTHVFRYLRVVEHVPGLCRQHTPLSKLVTECPCASAKIVHCEKRMSVLSGDDGFSPEFGLEKGRKLLTSSIIRAMKSLLSARVKFGGEALFP